jgi:hypothetical protein
MNTLGSPHPMKKIDYRKELSRFYNPSAKEMVMVDVPTMIFLMVDGAGDPNTAVEFQEAVEALFGLSYTLKFMVKKGEQAIDYGVMPLEGLWWMDDMSEFDLDKKDAWKWTVMIAQPELITPDLVTKATEQVRKKKDSSALAKVRFEPFPEGKAAQIMHLGPFSEEGPTVERVHQFIEAQGYTRRGKHHEIYLSDMRRAQPEKWRTVIRQPVG